MVEVKEKIERWKGLADIFLKEDTRAIITELNGNLHFCDILVNGENTILIKNFGPKQRKGIKESIRWLNIIKFDEYHDDI